MQLTPTLHVNVGERGWRVHVGYRWGCVCVCATHPHLYPLEARLYPQLLHRPPSVADVVGAVSLRRHGGEISTAGRGREKRLLYHRPERSLINSLGRWLVCVKRENPHAECRVDQTERSGEFLQEMVALLFFQDVLSLL